MKPASAVSQTVYFTINLTCLLSTTSSDIGLSSNVKVPLLPNNIESTGKVEILNHEFIVHSIAYTVKLSKKYAHGEVKTSIFHDRHTFQHNEFHFLVTQYNILQWYIYHQNI